jgi:hypothetical protein
MINRQMLKRIPIGDRALKITPGIKDFAQSAVTPWTTHTTTVMAARAVPACASMVWIVVHGTDATALFKLAIEEEKTATAAAVLAVTGVEMFKAAAVTCCSGAMALRQALNKTEKVEHRLDGEATCEEKVAAEGPSAVSGAATEAS